MGGGLEWNGDREVWTADTSDVGSWNGLDEQLDLLCASGDNRGFFETNGSFGEEGTGRSWDVLQHRVPLGVMVGIVWLRLDKDVVPGPRGLAIVVVVECSIVWLKLDEDMVPRPRGLAIVVVVECSIVWLRLDEYVVPILKGLPIVVVAECGDVWL